jgi:hypothetical protein
MRKTILGVVCLAFCAAALLAATEQPLNVKTGLWQVEMNIKFNGLPPDMQAMLDQMTPQQRAARGMGGTKTYTTCVTAKEQNTPWVQGDNECKWTVVNSTGSDLDVRGTKCRIGMDEGLNTEIEIKVHAIDSEHVHATMHGTGTGNGVNATLDGDYAGKWIGETCRAGKE